MAEWTDIINQVLDEQAQPVMYKRPNNDNLDKLGGGGGGGYSSGNRPPTNAEVTKHIESYQMTVPSRFSAHLTSTRGNRHPANDVYYQKELPVKAPSYMPDTMPAANMNKGGQIKEDPYLRAKFDQEWSKMVKDSRKPDLRIVKPED